MSAEVKFIPLQPCNECGAKISSNVRACPHCGVRELFQPGLQCGLNQVCSCLLWTGEAGLAYCFRWLFSRPSHA